MRRKILFGALLAVIGAASMFAPAPLSRTVKADERNACQGLETAFRACMAHNPNYEACFHIREQQIAHGCVGSSSGSGTGSGL